MATAWRRGAQPSDWTAIEIAVAAPGPGRVTVAIEAAAIDPWTRTPRGRVGGVAAVGRVIATGEAATEWQGARVLVKVDGDDQMDLAYAAQLVAPILLGEADYAKGNRFTSISHLTTMPTVRVLGNAMLSFLAKLSTGYWNIFDPTNGFTQGEFTIAAFKRRETSTTVEMRDGESFAIAGLLQDDFRNLNGQVPWLGDIPIIGALFRSAEYQRAQSELVIIVTPHLVTPTRGEVLALPTDRVRIPTERELFLYGRVAGAPKGAAGEVARQDFSGSYGYVME